jgi:SAM-dependent methyltransferase
VEPGLTESAASARARIRRGLHDAAIFRAELVRLPPNARDAWLDRVLGIGDVPDDGPALPSGCVPYLPCSVDALLRVIERAGVSSNDEFVDVGSGIGRAAMLVHLLTGAAAVGVEIQPALIVGARDLASRLALHRVSFVEGDAIDVAGSMDSGSVFFLYCPFSGERLAKVLDALETIACSRPIRICSVDLPLPPRAWLTLEAVASDELSVYRSV